MSRRVYLDHNASTPVHPDVVAEMLPYFGERFGNPSSVHGFGREARAGVDLARDRIAKFRANLKRLGVPFHVEAGTVPEDADWNADGHEIVRVTREKIADLVRAARRVIAF